MTEILDLPADAAERDRRARLLARAAAVRVLRASPAKPVLVADRQRIVMSTQRTDPLFDQQVAEERERT